MESALNIISPPEILVGICVSFQANVQEVFVWFIMTSSRSYKEAFEIF